MPKEQAEYIHNLQSYMLEAPNMTKDEAWSFAFRCWQFNNDEKFLKLVRGWND